MTALLLISLFFLACFNILLIRSFEFMSLRELKRQARKGNIHAAKVYSVRSIYSLQLLVLLWGIVSLCTAGTVLIIESLLSVWLAVVISLPILIFLHTVLPFSKKPEHNLGLAAAMSPLLLTVLNFLRPVLSVFTKLVSRWIELDTTARVHSKEEIIEILKHSERSTGFSNDEIQVACSALTFGDVNIGNVMTPIGVVKTVNEKDVLTPVMLDELHDSGFSRFPVKGNGDIYVGTLYFKDAVNMDTSHTVKNIMRKEVFYVNEAAMLDHALKAFLKTQHHLFMVVNEYEDVVGVITIEDILERIIGKKIVDEFDQYDDLKTVAKSQAEDLEKERESIQAPSHKSSDV